MTALRTASAGDLLREWRQRRRLSQLDLACEAEISTRHLSFVETGRATPSRDMVLRLAEQLEVPLRERNLILTAAGYAPVFGARDLADPGLAAARAAVDTILTAHEPFPAFAIDRHWNLLAANRGIGRFTAGLPEALLAPPVNVLRLALHPEGLAPRTANMAEWRGHLLHRVEVQIDLTADPVLVALLHELEGYPGGPRKASHLQEASAIAIPFKLNTDDGVLSFISTTTVFGTPVDITLSELALETFFPADEATAAALRAR